MYQIIFNITRPHNSQECNKARRLKSTGTLCSLCSVSLHDHVQTNMCKSKHMHVGLIDDCKCKLAVCE